jgi:hypothetical protein
VLQLHSCKPVMRRFEKALHRAPHGEASVL